MSIKNETFLKDLQPYSRMTVVPGVTVGDLNFASAQSVFSTGYIQPSAADTFAANQELDLFQAAIGDNGQGLAPGQVMSRGQTNWLDSQGRLPANEVFIGIRCLVSIYKHRNSDKTLISGASFASTGTPPVFSSQLPIPDVAAVYEIAKEFSWEYQTGDGIIRNAGALAGYPQGGGVWEAPLGAISAGAVGVQNGWPCPVTARELPIPFMYLPNITTRVKIRSGSQLGLTTGSIDYNTAYAEYLAIRMTFQGYKLTMPV